jgi:hypothetical protein
MERYQSAEAIIQDPQITVKSVCKVCNNGWMSDLEAKNIPVVGSMLIDLAIPLDRGMKELVAAWTIKTAMVLDSTRPKAAGNRFYSKDDCIAMRETLSIPRHTRIWIGRINTKHLLGLGTDYRYLHRDTYDPEVVSTTTTIVVGHFVAQSITQRRAKNFESLEMPPVEPKGTGWENYLTQIWPIEREWVSWPPSDFFTNGPPHEIAYLLDRWRVGERVDSSVIASSF